MLVISSQPICPTEQEALYPLPYIEDHSHSKSRSLHDVSATSRSAIASFVSRTKLDLSAQKNVHADAVIREAREIVGRWDIGDTDLRTFHAALATGITLADISWACTPFDVQVYIALLTAILTCIDDFASTRDALSEFSRRFLTGSCQLHPLLDRLAEVIQDTANHFLPLVANEINRAVTALIDAAALEYDMINTPLHTRSLRYVEMKREINGLGRAYALFSWEKHRFPDMKRYIQALPELTIFMNYVNDIFSFYKEELVGETANFVHERAVVTGRSVSECLHDLVDDAVASTATAREILKGTPEGGACEAVMGGYARWHIVHHARYRLGELFGDDLDALLTSSL